MCDMNWEKFWILVELALNDDFVVINWTATTHWMSFKLLSKGTWANIAELLSSCVKFPWNKTSIHTKSIGTCPRTSFLLCLGFFLLPDSFNSFSITSELMLPHWLHHLLSLYSPIERKPSHSRFEAEVTSCSNQKVRTVNVDDTWV